MAFSKDRLIVAQNSATAAAAIVASMRASDSVEGLLAAFDEIRSHIFEGSIAFADGAIAGQTEVQQAVSNHTPARSGGGGGSSDAGAGVAFKFGKHSGSTIAEVYASTADGAGPSYIEWVSRESNNDFMKAKATEFLASQN